MKKEPDEKQKKNYKTKEHPYMVPTNWLDGTLCFWRNNPMYSQKSVDYLEAQNQKYLESNLKSIHT